MLNDQASIRVEDSFHTLIILIHGKPIHGRGLLLLSASETEARIKYLDGFVAVSFFINESHDTIAEYIQWRTAAHLAAAFRRPEFNQHLPVIESLATAEVGFYSVERVIASRDDRMAMGPAFAGMADFQVFKIPIDRIDILIGRMVHWAEGIKASSKSLQAVAVHADRTHGKAACFMHPDRATTESVWYTDSEAAEIDRASQMMRYTTVSAPGSASRPLRYSMSCCSAPKAPHP
jgi:hypothetical protein